jgi:hypothetical protein
LRIFCIFVPGNPHWLVLFLYAMYFCSRCMQSWNALRFSGSLADRLSFFRIEHFLLFSFSSHTKTGLKCIKYWRIAHWEGIELTAFFDLFSFYFAWQCVRRILAFGASKTLSDFVPFAKKAWPAKWVYTKTFAECSDECSLKVRRSKRRKKVGGECQKNLKVIPKSWEANINDLWIEIQKCDFLFQFRMMQMPPPTSVIRRFREKWPKTWPNIFLS